MSSLKESGDLAPESWCFSGSHPAFVRAGDVAPAATVEAVARIHWGCEGAAT